jgi:hypothetical protein
MKFDPSSLWHWLYVLGAGGMSLFYGRYACSIFSVDQKDKPKQWHWHQFWFNFLGAVVGWAAAWSVLGSVLACAKGGCTDAISISSALIFLVAFVGVTGHLPMCIFGFIGGLREFIAKLASVIGGKP